MAVIPPGWSLDPHQHKTESDAQQQTEVQRELMPNREDISFYELKRLVVWICFIWELQNEMNS